MRLRSWILEYLRRSTPNQTKNPTIAPTLKPLPNEVAPAHVRAKVTKIAKAPSYIKGVINLRGDIVPIVDLRIKFDVGEATYNAFTIVIVLQINERMVGIVVDSVSDVIALTASQRRPPPEFGVAFDSRFLMGLAKLQNHMVILVNIEALVSSSELGLVDAALKKMES